MITKFLHYLCLFLLALCVGLCFVVSHQSRVIKIQQQSIEHGAAIQRVRLEMDSIHRAVIDRERERAAVLEVEYEKLKNTNTNLPRPKTPATSKAMREGILRLVNTE